MLYCRTAVVLFVSLYTTRLLLKALGADDLGIYNVVGGVVALMSFFRSSLSKATSRFITFEAGRNNDSNNLARIFSSAMTIHIIITAAVFVLGETVGLLILSYWTDIPETRQTAAFWVYQCSLVIFCIHILSSPYEAIVIAYEKMSVFAYISIFSAFSKLGIAIIMLNSALDRLVLYGVLLVVMDMLVFIFYYIYDRKNYPIFRFHFNWDAEYSRRLLGFSGWTLLGSSANAATQQGVSLLFNNFVGLVANTALGFANQVSGAVSQFVHSFQTAFNPQIIKLYAQHELEQMHLLMIRSSKFCFLLAYLFALPLIANMEFVLQLWLGEVPRYTVEFCQLILVCCVIDSTTGVFNTSITATGNIKGFQIGISISFLLDLATAAVLLLLHMPAPLVFGSRILTRGLINMVIELYFVRKQLSFSLRKYLKAVLVPISTILMVSVPLMWITISNLDGWRCFVVACVLSAILCAIVGWLVFLNKSEKHALIDTIKTRVMR
ncbi:MAG: hypothetical protein IJP44_02795 [Bacteroidales bacterium]|nr:hypothetical protein [Bacteroidales bacterium]